jgi:heme exporter protein C
MIFNIVVGIWIALGLVLGFAMPPAEGLVATPIAFLHVPMAFGMEMGLFGAAIYGGKWLKKRRPGDDAMSLALAETGFVFGIIATISGSLWAKLNWNTYWNWDPQQVGIVATLLTYAALFALRSAVDDEDKSRNLWAVYAIFGFIAAIFWTFIFRRLMPSLHPEDTTRTSDPLFRFALWFNIIGYTLLTVRVAQLRARLERASNQLKENAWISADSI